ncbi:MAG TPA: cation-translocating P-type ATPase [Candidatus Dormibacteraeota bacterium]|nr:cation-translocating P-type ATPase [Candidatus Dormibacteraeota bacterium]
MNDVYRMPSAAVLEDLGVELRVGLTSEEASRRLKAFGNNQLLQSGTKNPWGILWEQMTASVVVVLIAAAIISALLGDYKDCVVISAIVALNAALGFSQEYRAERALAALKNLSVPNAKVRRNGDVLNVSAVDIVQGDIILLEAGDLVPADCRVIESHSLQTVEAALTGESEPVAKVTDAIDRPDVPLGDRRNMAYVGTSVAAGRGTALVTATGMRTELGRIARSIQTVDREPTPLQRRLHHLGKTLAVAALSLVVVIFVLGLLRGENLRLMFLTAVSIGVAAVPEGLPAVASIALTIGAQRMLKKNALIRKLPAVETLGSVTVICTDKTGTLTENRMRVVTLQFADHSIDLTNDFSSQKRDELLRSPSAAPTLKLMLAGGALCNDSHPRSDQSKPPVGDPTEVALLTAASDFGLEKNQLERWMPRVAEVPFSSVRKRMTTGHILACETSELPKELTQLCNGDRSRAVLFTKGGVDILLEHSTTVWVDGRIEPLNRHWRERIAKANDSLARKGMRVIGLAFRSVDAAPQLIASEAIEQQMTFVGMFGLIDRPRREAALAVATCRSAGIRPVMITGDHALTAEYVAEKVGIPNAKHALTGPDLDRLSAQLKSVVATTDVFARVTPEHKLKIVQALQENGQIVAMTGDGVNDAPALKKADIGVAMGVAGSDVAKEASDIVLLDDNFATIVSAVKEGRIVYDNIRKFIKYILATNSGEIWTMLFAPFLNMPLPLLPLQILWMNLVTDGPPALALSVEPADPDIMQRPPYPPNERVFARGLGTHVIWLGLMMAFVSLGVGYGYWTAGRQNWQTMLFTTLTLSQMAHVMAIRSERISIFRIGMLTNKPLLAAVLLTVILQLGLIYVPFLQNIFNTRPLSAADLFLSVVLSTVILAAVEVEKLLRGSRQSAPNSPARHEARRAGTTL